MLGIVLSSLISIAAGGFVGVTLLGLARRTRQLPELCAGVGFLGFAVAQLAMVLAGGLGERLSPATSHLLMACSLFGFTVTQLGLGGFIVETFGPIPLRWTLLTIVVGPGIVARAMLFAHGTTVLGAGSGHGGLRAIAATSIALLFLWMGIEALRYHRKARRAYEIGVAGAEVVNRFLLLGVGGVLVAASTLGVAFVSLTAADPAAAPLRSYLIGFGGLVTAFTQILVFTPPAAYQRYVEAKAARAASRG